MHIHRRLQVPLLAVFVASAIFGLPTSAAAAEPKPIECGPMSGEMSLPGAPPGFVAYQDAWLDENCEWQYGPMLILPASAKPAAPGETEKAIFEELSASESGDVTINAVTGSDSKVR